MNLRNRTINTALAREVSFATTMDNVDENMSMENIDHQLRRARSFVAGTPVIKIGKGLENISIDNMHSVREDQVATVSIGLIETYLEDIFAVYRNQEINQV